MERACEQCVGTGGDGAPCPHVLAPPRAPPRLPPGTMAGEYRIERCVGAGGMGAVYAALHPVIGKEAAIKVLHPHVSASPDAVSRFIQEAQTVNRIGHPSIVDIFAFGVLPDGRQYFVMELLRGETFAQRLARGPLRPSEAIPIFEQVARALEAAHGKGVIHRDLKPDNVFLVTAAEEAPKVKLLDFGISKLVHAEGAQLHSTQTGRFLGTPTYVSPEQIRGRGVDFRTDLYALGVMLHEVFLRRRPFVAESAVDVFLMHLHQKPVPPRAFWPDAPEALGQLILGLLSKSPDARPSLQEVRATLAALRVQPLDSLPPPRASGAPVTPPPLPTSPARRRSSEGDGVRLAQEGAGLPQREDTQDLPSGAAVRRPVRAIALGAAALAMLAMAAVASREVWRPEPPELEAAAPVPAPAPAPPPEVPAVAAAPKTSRLTVEVDVPTAQVEIDGAPVDAPEGRASLTLARAGEHAIRVHAAGHLPFTGSILVPEGASVIVPVRLMPEPPRIVPARRPRDRRVSRAPQPRKQERPPAVSTPAPPPPAHDDDGVIDPFASGR